jgi:hypothetical protein
MTGCRYPLQRILDDEAEETVQYHSDARVRQMYLSIGNGKA